MSNDEDRKYGDRFALGVYCVYMVVFFMVSFNMCPIEENKLKGIVCWSTIALTPYLIFKLTSWYVPGFSDDSDNEVKFLICSTLLLILWLILKNVLR